MKTNLASWSRGRLIAVIAAGIVLLLLVGIGVYGLITGPRPPRDDAPAPAPTVTVPGETGPEAPGPPLVLPSHDPDQFARNVAEPEQLRRPLWIRDDLESGQLTCLPVRPPAADIPGP